MTVNDKFEGTQRETVVAYNKGKSHHMSGATEEDCRQPDQEAIPRPPGDVVGVLTTPLKRSVLNT